MTLIFAVAIIQHVMGKSNILQQIGNTIKTTRVSEGISAEGLSNAVNISRATLWSIENGKGNTSINTYLDIAAKLGLKIDIGLHKTNVSEEKRAPKRITKEKVKKSQFEVFCIEKYATHIGLTGSSIYSLFVKQGLLDLLRKDYEDLHGMGTEYLMDFFDSYLEGTKL